MRRRWIVLGGVDDRAWVRVWRMWENGEVEVEVEVGDVFGGGERGM